MTIDRRHTNQRLNRPADVLRAAFRDEELNDEIPVLNGTPS